MANKLNFSVNDLVVRYGKVLKVLRINQKTVSLQPFFHIKSSRGLTYVLKLNNAYDGHIRQLASKAKLKQLLKLIIKKPIAKKQCPAFNSSTALSFNKLTNTLWTVKTLWLEKQANSNSLTGGKFNIFQQAVNQTTEEMAAINQTAPEQEKLLLLSALKSSL